MLKLDIAGVYISIISNKNSDLNQVEPFKSNSQQKPDLEIYLISSEAISLPKNLEVQNDYCQWLRNNDNDSISVCIFKLGTKEIMYLIQSDSVWKKVTITFLDNDPQINSIIAGRLGEIIFLNRLLFHQGILIHAAAIEWEGKGIMFSAPSGTGKTTQANLWKQFMGAVVLNGDRSVVRIIDEKPYVHGSPWCGSSQEYLNRRSPLSAIIILEQAQENSIRRLDKKEAISRLMPRCFLPYYDGGTIMDIALENLEQVVLVTPIYLLRCRPDREAVELVCKCVK